MEKIFFIVLIIFINGCSPVLRKYKYKGDGVRKMKIVLYKNSTGYLENRYLENKDIEYKQFFTFEVLDNEKIFINSDFDSCKLYKKFKLSRSNVRYFYNNPTLIPILCQDTVYVNNKFLLFAKGKSSDRNVYVFLSRPYSKLHRKVKASSLGNVSKEVNTSK